MAVRRQLEAMLRDLQPGGTIVVEGQPPPVAPVPAPALVQVQVPVPVPAPVQVPAPVPAPVQVPAPVHVPVPAPPTSSSQPAGLVSLPRWQGLLLEPCAMFQCRGCWAVLSDSLHLCAHEEGPLDILVCYRVTKDVIWEDSLTIGLEGPLLGCAYHTLTCQLCGLALGFILYSASRELAYLRGFFCFFKDSILCYLLKSQIVVEASKMDFPPETLWERLQTLKEKLVESHTRIESLVKMLKKLEEKNNGQKGRDLQQMQLDHSQDTK